MCSFDVNSLFTNIPLKETVDFLGDFLEANPGLINLPVPILKDLILLCTKDVKFYFQGDSYRQIDGVAMGSPLGPTLADIFMASLERMVEPMIQELPLYKRYLDDILIIANDRNQIDHTLSIFSALHKDI